MSGPLQNQMSSRNREFDSLNVGDTVNFVQSLKSTPTKVVELDADTVTIEGGRTFSRSTGYACDGAIVFIQAQKK